MHLYGMGFSTEETLTSLLYEVPFSKPSKTFYRFPYTIFSWLLVNCFQRSCDVFDTGSLKVKLNL
jgi:hypothetical protein